MDVLSLWKYMGETRRTAAANAFFADDAVKEFHAAANTYIARLKNFRPQFVKKLPLEKRAFYLATLPLSQELASQLIVNYHFAHQRPMMGAFLNALGVDNDNGLIKEDAEIGSPTPEQLSAAVQEIRSRFPEEDVNIYLLTLQSQNPEVWGVLSKHTTVAA
jgi:hypothetical protein